MSKMCWQFYSIKHKFGMQPNIATAIRFVQKKMSGAVNFTEIIHYWFRKISVSYTNVHKSPTFSNIFVQKWIRSIIFTFWFACVCSSLSLSYWYSFWCICHSFWDLSWTFLDALMIANFSFEFFLVLFFKINIRRFCILLFHQVLFIKLQAWWRTGVMDTWCWCHGCHAQPSTPFPASEKFHND